MAEQEGVEEHAKQHGQVVVGPEGGPGHPSKVTMFEKFADQKEE
jgi:hypothetical protein